MSIPLEQLPEAATTAWTRLRDELEALLGDDLVAMWAYGGTTAVEGPPRSADLDTYVIVRHPLDEQTAQAIEEAQAAIAADIGVEWDTWYVLEEAARRPRRLDMPSARIDATRRGRSTERIGSPGATPCWPAGSRPSSSRRRPGPSWRSTSTASSSISRPTSPRATPIRIEATYAILNGSRIIRALETGDVAISKRSAGHWALEHLPARWHPALRAAGRAYDGGNVGGHRPARDARWPRSSPWSGNDCRPSADEQPRWSGS